jgi:SAM-dependent methyltransferase
MPSEELLHRYYATYHSEREQKVTFANKDRFAGHLARAILPLRARASVRILDFGGGDGTLALALAERLSQQSRSTYEIVVVDRPAPVAAGDARIRICSAGSLDDVRGQYDLVIASAVLEHIPALHSLLPQLFERIAAGGMVYCRTPFAAPLHRFPGVDFGYPAHVHDLGAAFWSRFASTFGLPLRTCVSRPSLVAASWTTDPLRTFASHVLKIPARLECAIRGDREWPLWPFIGGWEVVFQRTS